MFKHRKQNKHLQDNQFTDKLTQYLLITTSTITYMYTLLWNRYN